MKVNQPVKQAREHKRQRPSLEVRQLVCFQAQEEARTDMAA